MENRNRSNILLVEILIAILFFMLSATILARVFAAARNMTVRAGVEVQALAQAQNVAETLCAAQDRDAALREMDFVSSHGAWSKNYGDYSVYVACSSTETEAGVLWRAEVSAFYSRRDPDAARQQDERLFTLPCARYEEVPS